VRQYYVKIARIAQGVILILLGRDFCGPSHIHTTSKIGKHTTEMLRILTKRHGLQMPGAIATDVENCQGPNFSI
jgi:hypothetical protein